MKKFWHNLFNPKTGVPKPSELNCKVRYGMADLITENNDLKKELKAVQSELERVKVNSISYLIIIEDLEETVKGYRKRFK